MRSIVIITGNPSDQNNIFFKPLDITFSPFPKKTYSTKWPDSDTTYAIKSPLYGIERLGFDNKFFSNFTKQKRN